jgi:stress-induced morphogen
MKPVEAEIITLLTRDLQPAHLEVINESHMHSVPPGSESHFKVVLVSELFEGKRQVARHQAVYAALRPVFEKGLHALALHTHSPAEWQQSGAVPDSPSCMGGSKHDQARHQ